MNRYALTSIAARTSRRQLPQEDDTPDGPLTYALERQLRAPQRAP